MNIHHKQAKDENFPVSGFFVRKDLRPIVEAYYDFARMADDIADNSKLSSGEKIRRLHSLEEVLDGHKVPHGASQIKASQLRDIFIKNHLDFSLATDLLIAFRQDSMGYHYETLGQLVNYCTYSAAPVGRFMLAIYDENPASYIPAASLCSALQIVNHLQDIKDDAIKLKRIYLPKEFLENFGVDDDALRRDTSSEGLRKVIRQMSNFVRGQLKESEILLQIVKDNRLRLEIAVIISLTNILLEKILKEDVMSKKVKLSSWNKFCGLVQGIIKFFSRHTYTLPEGIK